jgi:hypothetical protein
MSPRKVELDFGNKANVLEYLGQHYKNQADAIKEYVSNALDEWNKLFELDPSISPCEVRYTLQKTSAQIEYDMPGMTEKEFESVLKSIAKSSKAGAQTQQIGEKGIGILAFNYFANKCTVFSRRDADSPTIKVVLRKGSAEADFDKPLEKEKLNSKGMRFLIEGFDANLTKPNGPLCLQKLSKSIAAKFDWYIRDGKLKVIIQQGEASDAVKAPDITLPRLAKTVKELPLSGAGNKRMKVAFWYDPAGKSQVSIRHKGVVVLDDVAENEWFKEAVFASGQVKGYIDADFLKPLPSRTNFEANEEWFKMIEALDQVEKIVADEIEDLKLEQLEETKRQVVKNALEMAREILDQEAFKDLQMLSGLTRKREERKEQKTQDSKEGKNSGERSQAEGTKRSPSGLRISYVEQMFPEGAAFHSKFVAGTVYANTLNEDFKHEVKNGKPESQLEYIGLIIGKETLALNDTSRFANDFLERMLTFLFSVKKRTGSSGIAFGKRKKGSRPKALKDIKEPVDI